MHGALRVARFEFSRHVRQRRFVVATLGLPVLLVLLLGIALWAAERLGGDELPWGIVGAGDIPAATVRFASEAAAEDAVTRGAISGYVVLRPEGRALARATGRVPPELAQALADRAEDYVVAGVPETTRELVRNPAEFRYASVLNTMSALSGGQVAARSIGALVVPLFFALAVLFASSFLVQAVTEEKGSRIIEILVTSATPNDLIAGKVLGLGALSLTQTVVWLAIGGAVVSRISNRLMVPNLGDIPAAAVVASLPYFVLGYIVYAALMVGIGIVVGSPRDAQQVSSAVAVFLVLPFIVVTQVMDQPGSPAAVAMSLFPLTSPVVMPTRLMMSAVPADTWILGIVLLVMTAAFLVAGVGRIFRAQMLAYGEPPSLRQILALLR